MIVRLKGTWHGSFSRSVRDEDGKVIDKLTFMPGVAVAIDDEAHLAAIKNDLGKALDEITDADVIQRLRPPVDLQKAGIEIIEKVKATAKSKAEAKKAAAAAKKLTAAK